jgi:hypothetical protein
MEIGLLARPPQEPTHLLGTSQVMWKALFIVFFYHNKYFSSNNIQFFSLKYIIVFILGIISYTEVRTEFVTSLFVGRGLYIHGGLALSNF